MPNRSLFKKFGHNCEIQKPDYGKHILQGKFEKYKKYMYKSYWKFRQIFLINETNRRGYNYLRSQKKMENEYRKQLMYTFTIHPFSDFRKYWELFMSIILLLQIYTVTLFLAICNMKVKGTLFSKYFVEFKYMVDFMSFVDVCLSFMTGYCNEKDSTVIIEPKRIIRHYLLSSFVIDLICSVPLDIIIHANETYMDDLGLTHQMMFSLRFICLVKLCRIPSVVKYINNIFEVYDYSYMIYRIFIVTLCFITYIHILCCVLMAWVGYENTWSEHTADSMILLRNYGPQADTFTIVYILSFYSTCLLVMNTGYNLASFSNASLLFMVNVWIVTRIIFILILAYFMELYTVTQSSRQKFLDTISEVKDCMAHKHIPEFLRKRILTYYDVKFQNYYFQESEILNTVSGQLRQEIVMNTCRKLVERVTFFKHLPLPLLVRIVSCLRYEIYLTNDVVAKAGTTGDSMYFIANGTVAVYTRFGQEICHLKDGDHFGEVALVIKDTNRIASVVAAEVCELYRLEKKDFVRAILPYPDLLEKITSIAGDRVERTEIMNEAIKYQTKTKASSFSTY